MKFRVWLTIVVIVLLSSNVLAQDDDVDFVPFESAVFSIQGIVPDGWAMAAPGAYQRGNSDDDVASIIVQSAPLAAPVLLDALQGQLGVETLPESESQIETEIFTWDVYQVDVEADIVISVTMAVAESDNTTYLVLLQSTVEERETLVETVFNPVVESVMPLVESEDEMAEVSYSSEEVTFMSGDLSLAGTLTIPEGEGEFPVVVLVSGSGPQDRDESLAPIAELKPFRDIADYLSSHGIAVLRYDDRGVGASEGDYANSNLYDFRDDAEAAVNYLADRNEFSTIGIVGHSEGGIYAPEIALNNDSVDFVIGLAAPTVSLIDILREQNKLIFAANGADEAQVEAIALAFDGVVTAYNTGGEDDLETALTALVEAQTGDTAAPEIVQAAVAQFLSPIFMSYFEYDPTPFWQEIDIPTLAIFGSLDLQVSAEQNIAALEDNNDNITIVTIEGMNHVFQIAETGSPNEYGTLKQSVNTDMLEIMTDWILELAE